MSELGRCRDCRWWGKIQDAPAFIGGWGICRRMTEADVKLIMYGYVSDADVATSPDFGCVQFEAKS